MKTMKFILLLALIVCFTVCFCLKPLSTLFAGVMLIPVAIIGTILYLIFRK